VPAHLRLFPHLHQVKRPRHRTLRRLVEEDVREAHFSAQHPTASQEARLPRPHVHPRRTCRAQEPPRQGSRPTLGLIVALRNRAAFEHLARHGKRIRRPALWCSWCPEPTSSSTSVAYALGRALGPAVVRNRLRRRLRAIIRSLEPQLLPGLLLIGANQSALELTFEQLTAQMTELVQQMRAMPAATHSTQAATATQNTAGNTAGNTAASSSA
jgi:ribonuclease P protein component